MCMQVEEELPEEEAAELSQQLDRDDEADDAQMSRASTTESGLKGVAGDLKKIKIESLLGK